MTNEMSNAEKIVNDLLKTGCHIYYRDDEQKAAKAYIGSKSTKVYKHKDFYCGYRWTGEKWINENSGEENEETYIVGIKM